MSVKSVVDPLEIPVVAIRKRAGHQTPPELFWDLTPLQAMEHHF